VSTWGLGLGNGEAEALRVDDEQHVALMDELVVGDPDFGDGARDLRGDVDDLRQDAAIAGPGGDHVGAPQGGHGDYGERHHGQGDGGADQET
jgi:hypothetical protein